MIVTLLCTSRSGSTNLGLYLSAVLKLPFIPSPFMRGKHGIEELSNPGVYKLFIHNQTLEFDSLYKFGEAVIHKSNLVILYDRTNKIAQAESLAYKKTRYKDNLKYYHNREKYDLSIVEDGLIDKCLIEFKEHSIALKQLSVTYNIPIFLYEDIYYNDGLKNLSEYLGVPIDYNLKNKFINLNNKERKSYTNLI